MKYEKSDLLVLSTDTWNMYRNILYKIDISKDLYNKLIREVLDDYSLFFKGKEVKTYFDNNRMRGFIQYCFNSTYGFRFKVLMQNGDIEYLNYALMVLV